MMEKPQDPKDFSENPFQDFAAVNPADLTPLDDTEITEPPKMDKAADAPDVAAEQSDPVAESPRGAYYPRYNLQITDPRIDVGQTPREFADSMRAKREGVSFLHEKPPTDEEWAEITTMHGALVTVSDEVGVDIRDRLPTRKEYHLFDDNETFQEGTTAHYGFVVSPLGGTYDQDTGVLIARRENPLENRHVTTHETAHSISAYSGPAEVFEDESGDENAEPRIGVNAENGYVRDVSPSFNEVVTNMLTLRTEQHLSDSAKVSYVTQCIIADEVIWKTARHHRKDIREIEDSIIRGMLTGERDGVALIKEALGEERASKFFGMETELDHNAAIAFAQELGYPAAVRALERYRDTGDIRIFDWYKVPRTPGETKQ